MTKFGIFAISVLATGLLSGCGESAGSNPGSSGSAGIAGSAGASSGGNSSGGASGGGAGTGNPGGSGSGGAAGGAGAGGSAGSGGQAPTGVPFVYVGGTDGNISLYGLDLATRTLTFREAVDAGDYPSFIAVDPQHRYLYAVNEGTAEVAAFSINQANGALTFLNRVDSGGGAPAHVAVDQAGGYVMVANYNGGSVRVFPISADGSLGTPTDTEDVGINPHLIITDAANQFAFVPTKGSDMIAQYTFSAGQLAANAVPQVTTASGAGPRHMVFSPNGDFAYVINELDSTMNAYSYDKAQGRLTEIDSDSTLPPGFNGQNTCAEVVVAPSGLFLYGSNRGHDSIVIYAIETNGELTYVANDASGGSTPRNFTLDPTGTVMLVANRDTSNVVVFSVDGTTGRIVNESEVSVEQPEYVGVVMLPGQ
jgi:6-phosphogluconolactonase